MRHFAEHGSEKMIYDARMHPQAIAHEDRIYVAYQANGKAKAAHPHVIAFDEHKKQWSQSVQLGEVGHVDHHFAPILWMENDGRLHSLYGCHRGSGRHLISKRPCDIAQWQEAPPIGDSISYPSVWRMKDSRLLLVHRIEGHLGYWVYRLSDDEGMNWGEARTLIDFDRDPLDETDRWAGSYLGVWPSRDRESLHIGFCYLEERKHRHPKYKFKSDRYRRYNLYYLRLNISSGSLKTIDGQEMPPPVNRREAEAAMVWNSGIELTNFPSLAEDNRGNPCLLAPATCKSAWHCVYQFFRWDGGDWLHSTFAETDNIWSGSFLVPRDGDTISAYVICGHGKREEASYGGGTLEEWTSLDRGTSWKREREIMPEPGLLYNNPKPVTTPLGEILDDNLLLFGWQGPQGVWNLDSPAPNRALAYLWRDGDWL